MRTETKFQIELIAGNDPTREALANAYYDPSRKRIVATNGHMLVVAPADPDAGDAAGPVTAEALKAARKVGKKSGTVEIHANGALAIVGGATFPRPADVPFPPIDNVIPQYRPGQKGTVTLSFNAHYLAAMVKAMGVSNGLVNLTIGPDDDGMMPIYVEPNHANGAFGVLMPVRR